MIPDMNKEKEIDGKSVDNLELGTSEVRNEHEKNS